MNKDKKRQQSRTFTLSAYSWNIFYRKERIGFLTMAIYDEFDIPLLEKSDIKFKVTITAADQGKYTLVAVYDRVASNFYWLYKTDAQGKRTFVGMLCKNKLKRLFKIIDSPDFQCDIKVERLFR